MSDQPVAINVYCDESSHLEKDHQPFMVLGAVWGPASRARHVADRLREIKRAHGLSTDFEAKWSKVSPAKLNFYAAVFQEFFDDDALHFRGVVAPKVGLDHESFEQDHDTWYFKMYFLMLSWIVKKGNTYRIYLDVKDTRSASKMRHLHDVLCSSKHDFEKEWIQTLQAVRSHEVEQVQLADLLVGALNYANSKHRDSPAKLQLVDMLRKRGYSLESNSSLSAQKFNVFRWNPTSGGKGPR